MRIWDIDPGYLNRQSLLGEHLELHGIASIIINEKKGYSRHPETIRWLNYGWALHKRHRQLSAEMSLRGYVDKSPVHLKTNKGQWPDTYIDQPFHQFEVLQRKYKIKEPGRILLPKNAQELWRHHKYSVLARDIKIYQAIGSQVSKLSPRDDFSDLAKIFSKILRVSPSKGGVRNSLQHMWGYVSKLTSTPQGAFEQWSLKELLEQIQERAVKYNETYLLSSTALAELMVWIDDDGIPAVRK
ncbi:MAG: DUF1722 domain-containing protein [Candidatus Electrothrix sp. AR3]|nr:DUF1722 domain-containing protein [Candidatus Electrothrix sp. AR3]